MGARTSPLNGNSKLLSYSFFFLIYFNTVGVAIIAHYCCCCCNEALNFIYTQQPEVSKGKEKGTVKFHYTYNNIVIEVCVLCIVCKRGSVQRGEKSKRKILFGNHRIFSVSGFFVVVLCKLIYMRNCVVIDVAVFVMCMCSY